MRIARMSNASSAVHPDPLVRDMGSTQDFLNVGGRTLFPSPLASGRLAQVYEFVCVCACMCMCICVCIHKHTHVCVCMYT